MIKRTLIVALACSLLLNAVAPLASARTQKDDAKRVARVKSAIDALGTGKSALVAVRLRDKSELKGYISEKDEQSFVITDERTGATTRVLYAQVEKVLTAHDVAMGMIHDDTRRIGKRFALGAVLVGGLVFLLVGAITLDN